MKRAHCGNTSAGRVICPRGWVIDEERLREREPDLCRKLEALSSAKRAAA